MFVWRFLTKAGVATGSSDPFVDRDAAEAWLAERWEELRDGGVEQVELLARVAGDAGEPVYRMSLAAER